MRDAEFTEWATGCQQQLLRTAYLLTGDVHRAEDLLQEALVKVALRWDRLHSGNPRAYARQVMVHDNISWWRKHRRERITEPPEGTTPAADADSDALLVVRRALARLTERQRAVVVLRHFEDLSVRETAAVLGVSEGTVKSQNAAALERLRTGAPELLDLRGRTS